MSGSTRYSGWLMGLAAPHDVQIIRSVAGDLAAGVCSCGWWMPAAPASALPALGLVARLHARRN